MFVKNRKTLTIVVEDSKENSIINPEYLLFMDKVQMNNGDEFLVTKASQDEIEVCMNKTIKKEKLSEFLKEMKCIIRAECFEKK